MISGILMPQADIDYYLHLYSINRLSDGGVIKVPFRLSDQDPIDDYFECIVECEDGDKSCALECRSLLE